jgi:hypothetical protein
VTWCAGAGVGLFFAMMQNRLSWRFLDATVDLRFQAGHGPGSRRQVTARIQVADLFISRYKGSYGET